MLEIFYISNIFPNGINSGNSSMVAQQYIYIYIIAKMDISALKSQKMGYCKKLSFQPADIHTICYTKLQYNLSAPRAPIQFIQC